MRSLLITGFLFLTFQFTFGQKTARLSADLQFAPRIEINQKYTFSKSPSGYGTIRELRLYSRRPSYIFREERNSAWFLIDIPFSGILTFELVPHNARNDYDWMLYQYSADLGNLIQKDQAVPLRTNNARNQLKGITGLKANQKNPFAKPGPGSNFSSELIVRTGSKLALVIDNIYGGQGFDLIVRIKPQTGSNYVLLEGTVKSKNSKRLLPAEIIIEDDSTGTLLGKTMADAVTGRYKVLIPVNRPVNSTAYHPDYLFATENILAKENMRQNFELDSIATGNKLILFNIHFYPNKDQVIPSAWPELDRLLRFLKEHPQWSVKIIGHTNNNLFASARYLQQLSFNRALSVKQYLLDHAIAPKRVSCAGQGGKQPLINTTDSVLGMKNLRVEVLLEKTM